MAGHGLILRKEISSAAIEMSEILLCLLSGTKEFPRLEGIIVETVAVSEVFIYCRYIFVV